MSFIGWRCWQDIHIPAQRDQFHYTAERQTFTVLRIFNESLISSEAAATDLDQLQSTCSSYVIISSGFLSIPYCRFITVKAVFTNFAARRLYQNGFGLAEVVCMMSSAAYQAKKRSNNVQLAEETVAHRQAHALKRV
ncbi:unnamed protein product [Brassica rapa]|uniref:Uncharacterized protein n=2 Tax=Brassica TaxID=3705 RepID=A0A8D9H747_BRACM|nr:unnamed protein product [Brassica napus]CAG7893870.1 unnamed protein product [Brassica rapa]